MTEINYSEGDIIEVRWVDAQDVPDWIPIDIAKSKHAPLCKTVGYLLSDDNDCMILATSVCEDLEASLIIIPKGMVKSIRKIEDSELEDFR